uniref:Uncharacterized protein n=1 Tax=Molossus molossus TaxID=27622 RepID=A0A7J8DTR4_MOLMO|nr:hypothetical protein HJG59_009180 [Molossus molossus]
MSCHRKDRIRHSIAVKTFLFLFNFSVCLLPGVSSWISGEVFMAFHIFPPIRDLCPFVLIKVGELLGTFRLAVPEMPPDLNYRHKAGEPASGGLSEMFVTGPRAPGSKVHVCRVTPTSDRVTVF